VVAEAHVVPLAETNSRLQWHGKAGSRGGTILPILSSSQHTVSR
jgi:hypothetical protein